MESVALSPDGRTILSGDWDGRLCIWKRGNEEGEGEDEGSSSSSSSVKRRNLGAGAAAAVGLAALTPSAAFKAHAQCVAGVATMERVAHGGGDMGGDGGAVPATCVTASWDHSVKTWDLERQDVVATINGSKVNTCMAFGRASGLVATGHPDGLVRFWDGRQAAEASVGCVASATGGGWVSGVAWCGEHLIATSSHDGALRLYDDRSGKPL